MDMTRRNFLWVSLLATASVITGCASGRPKINPEKDSRINQPWPKKFKKPDFKNLDEENPYAFTVRFATDKKGNFIKNEKGEYLIDGLTTPPLVLKKGEEPRIYETVFKEPVPLSDIGSAQQVAFVGNRAKAKKLRKMLNEVARKVKKAFAKKKEKEIKIAVKKDLIDKLNKTKEKLATMEKNVDSFWKRNVPKLKKPAQRNRKTVAPAP